MKYLILLLLIFLMGCGKKQSLVNGPPEPFKPQSLLTMNSLVTCKLEHGQLTGSRVYAVDLVKADENNASLYFYSPFHMQKFYKKADITSTLYSKENDKIVYGFEFKNRRGHKFIGDVTFHFSQTATQGALAKSVDLKIENERIARVKSESYGCKTIQTQHQKFDNSVKTMLSDALTHYANTRLKKDSQLLSLPQFRDIECDFVGDNSCKVSFDLIFPTKVSESGEWEETVSYQEACFTQGSYSPYDLVSQNSRGDIVAAKKIHQELLFCLIEYDHVIQTDLYGEVRN